MHSPEMNSNLSPSAQRVQYALQARGFSFQVVELPDRTRSAAEAAEAIGCQVGKIAKSLIFKELLTERPILVIASGSNRVNVVRIANLIEDPIGQADAAFVKQKTGFSIGGVPPVGHLNPLITLIDKDLFDFPEIWAAAGTPTRYWHCPPSIWSS
jgi:prolyl-tRNA editing enzyme YbaK/EbsC (Cys-tRNA(Pro) deacylase)